MSEAYEFIFPLYLIVENADPTAARFQVDEQSQFTVGQSGSMVILAVFTEKSLATQFRKKIGGERVIAKVRTLEAVIAIAELVQRRDGCTHIGFDPGPTFEDAWSTFSISHLISALSVRHSDQTATVTWSQSQTWSGSKEEGIHAELKPHDT